jgi:signal transduction histidine kinase
LASSDFARVLGERREDIVARFVAAVRQVEHPPQGLSPSVLADHIPRFLDEIIAEMGRLTEEVQPSPGVRETARRHGEQRWSLGYDLEAVIREYDVLRHCILETARKEGVVPSIDEFDSLVGFLATGVMEAATEYVQYRDRQHDAQKSSLEAAMRAKDEFVAMVSHELRTPLNVILGWLRLLRGGALPEEKRDHALEVIERNAHAQSHLVTELLDISQAITGNIRLSPAQIDLGHVVDQAIDGLRPAADAKHIAFEVDVERDHAVICGDGDRLRQVVSNLVANAVKFTPKGGLVRVRLRRAESDIELTVEDNGVGIDREFLPHIFESCRQSDTSASRPHGGLGIGLSIARHLVELHGGSIEASSSGPGRGATFVVRLPVP